MNKFYWCHEESESIGIVTSKEEVFKLMDSDPLVQEISYDEFIALKTLGYIE